MPPLEGMMKALGTPNITPELKQKVINGVVREAAGRSVEQLAQEENRVLIGFSSYEKKLVSTKRVPSRWLQPKSLNERKVD